MKRKDCGKQWHGTKFHSSCIRTACSPFYCFVNGLDRHLKVNLYVCPFRAVRLALRVHRGIVRYARTGAVGMLLMPFYGGLKNRLSNSFTRNSAFSPFLSRARQWFRDLFWFFDFLHSIKRRSRSQLHSQMPAKCSECSTKMPNLGKTERQ